MQIQLKIFLGIPFSKHFQKGIWSIALPLRRTPLWYCHSYSGRFSFFNPKSKINITYINEIILVCQKCNMIDYHQWYTKCCRYQHGSSTVSVCKHFSLVTWEYYGILSFFFSTKLLVVLVCYHQRVIW